MITEEENFKAQEEYDKNPELQELLARAIKSPRVPRPIIPRQNLLPDAKE